MQLSRELIQQLMTPSGLVAQVPSAAQAAQAAQPHTPTPASPTTPQAPPQPALEAIPLAFPKLDSSMTKQGNTPDIPWHQLMINLYRIGRPTGVSPGTYGGVTVNANGQVVNTQASGATFDSPQFTGTPIAPNPPANDNSQAIATTQWVNGEGFAKQSDFQTAQTRTQQQFTSTNSRVSNTENQVAGINTTVTNLSASVATNTSDIASILARLAAAGIP